MLALVQLGVFVGPFPVIDGLLHKEIICSGVKLKIKKVLMTDVPAGIATQLCSSRCQREDADVFSPPTCSPPEELLRTGNAQQHLHTYASDTGARGRPPVSVAWQDPIEPARTSANTGDGFRTYERLFIERSLMRTVSVESEGSPYSILRSDNQEDVYAEIEHSTDRTYLVPYMDDTATLTPSTSEQTSPMCVVRTKLSDSSSHVTAQVQPKSPSGPITEYKDIQDRSLCNKGGKVTASTEKAGRSPPPRCGEQGQPENAMFDMQDMAIPEEKYWLMKMYIEKLAMKVGNCHTSTG